MDGTEELLRREFLLRTAMAAGLAAGVATVLSPDALVAEAAIVDAREDGVLDCENVQSP